MIDENVIARADIINEIIETFRDNPIVFDTIKKCLPLTNFLRSMVESCQRDRDKVLESDNLYMSHFNNKSEGFKQSQMDDLGISLLIAKNFAISKEQNIYRLYSAYCKYFLGEMVSYLDWKTTFYEEYKEFNLRNIDGLIDYTPYLEFLGITNIDDLGVNQGGGRK